MSKNTVDKEKSAQIKALLPQLTSDQTNSNLYKDELAAKEAIETNTSNGTLLPSKKRGRPKKHFLANNLINKETNEYNQQNAAREDLNASNASNMFHVEHSEHSNGKASEKKPDLAEAAEAIDKKSILEDTTEETTQGTTQGTMQETMQETMQKKPRYDANSQPNSQKCKFSPFAYHRFTRAHKEKTKNGSVIMVLRCRYCFEMQQVVIDFVKKEGKYIAVKTVSSVGELEGPQKL